MRWRSLVNHLALNLQFRGKFWGIGGKSKMEDQEETFGWQPDDVSYHHTTNLPVLSKDEDKVAYFLFLRTDK